MALSKRDKERINLMNPVANDIKLGEYLAELEDNEGGDIDAYTKAEADDKFQGKGDYANKGDSYTKAEADDLFQAKGDYALESALAALEARVEALENAGDGES